MRARDGEHAGIGRANAIGFDAEAAGDDDLAVLGKRLADGGKRFLLGAVQEAAGVDHDGVRPVIARGERITFGAELGDDPLRIDERLGAAQTDEADRRSVNPWRGALRRGWLGGGDAGICALIGKRHALVCLSRWAPFALGSALAAIRVLNSSPGLTGAAAGPAAFDAN